MSATAKVQPAVNTSTWLTRRQASDLLGVSEGTLISWERRGLLHPQYEARGESLRQLTIYDPDELARVPHKHRKPIPNAPGEQAARAFEMFSNGKTVREVVIDLREVPEKVFELYERWLDAGGCSIAIAPAAWKELEASIGPFQTVTDLVHKVRERFTTIEATVPEGASDAQIETAIGKALDTAGAPR